MPRKKNTPKARARSKPKGPPQHIRDKIAASSSRPNHSFARPHGYTLAEEARNTASNRRGLRGRDLRLRYQPVTFISAGLMDPLKDFEIPVPTHTSKQPEATVRDPDVSSDLAPKAADYVEPCTGSPAVDRAVQREPILEGKCLEDGSDVGSDSSDEVILFKGRNAARQQRNSPLPEPIIGGDDGGDIVMPREISLELRIAKESMDVAVDSDSVPKVGDADFVSFNMNSQRSSSRKPRSKPSFDEDDEEAAIIADYIANMRAHDNDDDEDDDVGHPGLGSHAFSILRDLGGTDSDAIPSQPSSEAESGDELDEEPEADADARRRLESEDERLARIIAKQEELGLCDDDGLLLDGAYPDDEWIAAASVPRRKKKAASKKARLFQGGGQFPSATRMAEAFDELDLMDMQNARLQSSKKGPISFGLSDSELEDALNIAMKKDRLKKAERKKAREELRSQGLLGKNADPDDLRIKYRGGMTLDDLADEFEAFMLGTREQLILPPLDKHARKIIHMIANTFNIKSRSTGAGTGRHPVLYRVKGTRPYDEAMFEQVFGRVHRVWFPRVDVEEAVVQQTRVLKRAEARTGKSRVGKSSINLREGDIVGQHASEIGVENKGRVLLEKMGWTKGMSLGTVETQGIIVPLTHVVKKSKAGLGDA